MEEPITNDALYFEILEFLLQFGFKNEANLSPIISNRFPENANYGSLPRENKINGFLNFMDNNGHIIHTVKREKDNGDVIGHYGLITIPGYDFLSNYKRDQSTLSTNESIRKNSRSQTYIILAALIISVVNLAIVWLAYKKPDVEINDLQQRLKRSERQIEQLTQPNKQSSTAATK
jgi:hypothetical protein